HHLRLATPVLEIVAVRTIEFCAQLFLREEARGSPLRVVGENVVSCLHDRVAPDPTLGVVPLRRLVSLGSRREHIWVAGVNISDAASYLNTAYPHPPASANLLLSFTMKS